MTIQAGDTAYVAYGYEDPDDKTPFYYASESVVRRPPIDVPKDENYYFRNNPPRHHKYVFETVEGAHAMVDELIKRFGGKRSSYGIQKITADFVLKVIEEES